jgi:8-oxo-dGTP pyrophosphatase MutT (NUDIX family)
MADPSYPIPVVRLFVTDSKGKVLLLKRDTTSHAQGAWCLPGGKVDYGDTVEEAAARELHEETGLVCTKAKFLFYQDSLPPATGEMHCINFYFECQVSKEIQLNEESSESAWIAPSDIKDYEIAFRNDVALLNYWKSKGDSSRD